MPELLKINNIETSYGLIQALNGISLSVEQQSITAILGNNGAGKTTLLKTIMGLIDDQPETGSIEFDGQRIDGWDTAKIVRLGIACVPEGREIFPELTVKENLLAGAYTRRSSAQEIKNDMERVYTHFPVLKERTNQWAGTLSGGEQQMMVIGRALMLDPRLLILDEPSLGLSPLLVKDIFKIIKTINKEGVTILLVEQNARMALSIASSGIVLENGRIVLKNSSQALLDDPNVKEFYLGVRPETSAGGVQRWKRKKVWR